MEQIIQNIGGLVGYPGVARFSEQSIYYFKSYFVILVIAIFGATPIFKNLANNRKINKIINVLEPIYLLIMLIICTSYIIDGSYNPFLYFRF